MEARAAGPCLERRPLAGPHPHPQMPLSVPAVRGPSGLGPLTAPQVRARDGPQRQTPGPGPGFTPPPGTGDCRAKAGRAAPAAGQGAAVPGGRLDDTGRWRRVHPGHESRASAGLRKNPTTPHQELLPCFSFVAGGQLDPRGTTERRRPPYAERRRGAPSPRPGGWGAGAAPTGQSLRSSRKVEFKPCCSRSAAPFAGGC